MHGNRIWRWAVLAAVLAVFGALTGFSIRRQEHSCMGVPVLSHRDKGVYGEYAFAELSCQLTFNGEPAPVDAETSTIYISQNITGETRMQDLFGELEVEDRYYMLRFLPDPRFEELSSAVKDGYGFTLLAICTNNTYMEYRVVFTTLPVISMTGEIIHKNEEEEDVWEGDLCLLAPADSQIGRFSVKSTTAQWHVRGHSARYQRKTSWKVSLKDADGRNRDLNLLGQGEDDDWILNPMSMDDTKLKEKLFIGLWNSLADQTPWNYKMASCEYVEVVFNHSYSGVYLLQRRVDQKYCGLAREDILLKGQNTWTPANMQEAYRIVDSPFDPQESMTFMEGIFSREDVSMIHPDNFLDVSLFLQYASAVDNTGYKNMYYLLKRQDEGYRMFMIPWDTDISWGVIYSDAFLYDYPESMGAEVVRMEYNAMLREYPQLDTMLSVRWQELRESVLAEEMILGSLEACQEELDRSGAMERDRACWEPIYGGQDSWENLTRFLQERLYRLDEYYGY